MQSVQRRFGKPRTADESQVAVLLKDFEDADKMLSRVSSLGNDLTGAQLIHLSDYRGLQGMARRLDRYSHSPTTPRLWLPGYVLAYR